MTHDWFEKIGLSTATVDVLRGSGLYDPMDMVCFHPSRLHSLGVSYIDLCALRAHVREQYAQELRQHTLNTEGGSASRFLDDLGWSVDEIRAVCDEADERRGTTVQYAGLDPEHLPAVRRMEQRASKRRHGHGESRKHFIRR